MREVHRAARSEVGRARIFDLGLVRNLGYYTGAVFQVDDPADGMPSAPAAATTNSWVRSGADAGGRVRAQCRSGPHRVTSESGRRGDERVRVAVRADRVQETLHLQAQIGIDSNT